MHCRISPNPRLLFSPISLNPSLSFPLFISKPKPKPYSLFLVPSSSSHPDDNGPIGTGILSTSPEETAARSRRAKIVAKKQ
ncbi:hypothetical protein SLA2020_189850 [Shorea laevis]